ncbi:MAG: serine hydrolase [Bacteroidales bacterium]|nr:serine hydrolase [Bacteroidales bacterium]
MIKKLLLLTLAATLTMSGAYAQKHKRSKHHKKVSTTEMAVATSAEKWADSVMSKMSLEEKVGQLMMIRVPLNMSKKGEARFVDLLKDNHVGGVCFFSGTADAQIRLTKLFQSVSKVPLFVATDAENGLGMRLKDCYSFPKQMLMGAMPHAYDNLIEQMGAEIGRQCRQMGVHINFAPVVDLNSNPKNPVIGMRSFGEDRQSVALKATAYMRGLQSQRVMAVAKHFPGHGDTKSDSHFDLPVINHTKEYIDTVDLYPFNALIKAGVKGVMTAHLQVNAYDNTPNRPSSLSEKLVQKLMREKMNFNGLIFTDGLDMKGVTKYYADGEGELQAMKAGNDVLLLPPDVEKSVSAIVNAARCNSSVKKMVEEHCHRILVAKYKSGLADQCPDLSNPATATQPNPLCDSISRQMALHAVTLIKNNGGLLPLKKDEPIDTTKIFVIYASPYNMMKRMGAVDSAQVVVLAYQDCPATRWAVDELLHGRAQFEGHLPVTAGIFKIGHGLQVDLSTPYDDVIAAGMDAECFKQIDSIVLNGIDKQAYPGCQLLVAKDGKVVYNRAYGHQTYDPKSAAVDTNTVYDIASLTKATATTLAVMRLVETGKIHLDDKISKYVPYLKHTNKKNITIREALSHFARLKDYDSYWKNAKDDDDPYMSVLKQIAKSDLNKEQKYVYSDLGFILLGDMVRYVSGQTLDHYVSKYFFQPMGLTHTTFCPLEHGIEPSLIAPTEQDNDYRHRLVRGTVHDQNADVMGGVAGHAGLFSNASELFKIYQMLLNGGTIDGKTYLNPKTIDLFNSRHYAERGNRRALGFDKPMFTPTKAGQTATQVSQSSFGHTGFTGTMFWVDPEYKLVYIFLSNRVHPNATPNKLAKMNIRTDIQTLIYKSMGVK